MSEQRHPTPTFQERPDLSQPDSQPRHRLRGWMIIIGIFAIMIVAALVYYRLIPLEAPVPDDAGQQVATLPQSFTDDGFPRLGDPQAPVLIEDFSSYACSHCRDFHEVQFRDLLDDIANGTVQFVMIPVPQVGWGAEDAAKAALCAGEQGQFWAMHDVLFDWQRRFITSTFDERRLKNGAANLGLDVAAFEQCMNSQRIQDVVEHARQEFIRRGLTGTPTFFINGQKVVSYREFDNLASRIPESESAP